MGVNRAYKRKQKEGCGCKLCKAHKGKWAPYFKHKVKDTLIRMDLEIKNYE